MTGWFNVCIVKVCICNVAWENYLYMSEFYINVSEFYNDTGVCVCVRERERERGRERRRDYVWQLEN